MFLLASGGNATAVAASGSPEYLKQILNQADSEKAYDEPFWKRLIFVRKEWTGEHKSMFDDSEFFLSPAGKHDRRAELQATITKFFAADTITVKKQTRHPQCFFPARWDWIRRRFKIDPNKFPAQACPDLDKYISFADYESVSLVFSNYFADNPGSLFGHTLLRLHRRNEAKSESGLLDDAANFAAMVPVMNPLTYPFQGLFGMFKGRFTLLPYSAKIQEYNNFESRDMWEYHLNMDKDEVRRLALVIWELSNFQLDYFYLDENCSFIILAMLEAVKPELELTKRYQIYAIPADTVKAVTGSPGLVAGISFKPSSQTRYLERAAALNSNDRKVFLDIVKRFEHQFNAQELEKIFIAHGCDGNCRLRVIDTLLEFIDFKEKKISIKEIINFSDLRKAALIQRARIPHPSPALTVRPERSRPDLGHLSSMWEAGSGWTNHGLNRSRLRWRPALHDLDANGLGYTDQLQIQVMDTVVTWDQERQRADLERFSLLELTTLGKHELGLSPKSWHFELGYDTRREHQHRYGRTFLETGLGGARFIGRFSVYGLVNFSGGYADDARLLWYAGAGPRVGFVWPLSDHLKWTGRYDYFRAIGRHQQDWRRAQSRLSYYWHSEHESFFEFSHEPSTYLWSVGHRIYF